MEVPCVSRKVACLESVAKSAKGYIKHMAITDPWIELLADVGSQDPEYLQIVNFIENRGEASEIPQDSELRAMEGMLQELSVFQLKNGKHIIVRKNSEIYTPKGERERILEVLHYRHLGEQMMIRQVKSKLFWPGMKKLLRLSLLQRQQVLNLNQHHQRK